MLAFTDITQNRSDVAGVMVVGDLVNHGSPEEYEMLGSIIDEFIPSIPMHYVPGNHEFCYDGDIEQPHSVENTHFEVNYARFREFAGIPDGEFYRYRIINGDYFIFLGTEDRSSANVPDIAYGYYSEAQREWLRNLLAKAAETNANAFVFMHQSIDETVSGSFKSRGQGWSGINDDELMREVIESYDNTFLFTGHSHWNLNSYMPFVNGGKDGASYFNTASTGYLWSDDDVFVPGSEGLHIEVYESCVLVRGRDFENQLWIPNVQALVKKNDITPKTLESASIRTTENQGIRFAGFVSDMLKESVSEYGTIVAVASGYEVAGGYNFENFVRVTENENVISERQRNGTTADGKKYCAGISMGEGLAERIYSTTDSVFGKGAIFGDGTYFTAVLLGVPREGYSDKTAARPYVCIDGKYYYGTPVMKSVYEVALLLHNEGNHNEYIHEVLNYTHDKTESTGCPGDTSQW